MKWGVWCEVSGGVTGRRAAWLRRDDALAVYDRKDDAEQEAARLNATIGRNPYRKAVKFPLVLCTRAAISRFALCESRSGLRPAHRAAQRAAERPGRCKRAREQKETRDPEACRNLKETR